MNTLDTTTCEAEQKPAREEEEDAQLYPSELKPDWVDEIIGRKRVDELMDRLLAMY